MCGDILAQLPKFEGWPRTITRYKRETITIDDAYEDPTTVKLRNLIFTISIFGGLFLFFIYRDFLTGGGIQNHYIYWGLVGVFYVFIYFILRSLFIKRVQIVFSRNEISVKRAKDKAWHSYNRSLPHKIRMEEHKKAYFELRQNKDGTPRLEEYTNSRIIVMHHISRRLEVAAIYPVERAEEFAERILGVDTYMDTFIEVIDAINDRDE